MLDWLRSGPVAVRPASIRVLILQLALALLFGCVVAGIYRLTHGKGNGQARGLMATLVLLTLLICMVTRVIGSDIARAFSLVGALAIVRFRTVVEDTRDTAFVIFAVTVGMAVGADAVNVALVGIPLTAAAAFLFRPRPEESVSRPTGKLTVRVGAGRDAEALLRVTFDKHLARSRLVATATARQGAALDLAYEVELRHENAALPLVTELNGLEGVQEVELRQA